jgi:curved DNA-binding protein CbpA
MIQPPCPHADHFSILGVPRTFDLDAALLEKALKRMQAAAHPDRYARASASERAHSAELSARANAAYAVLKSPLLRARYLVRESAFFYVFVCLLSFGEVSSAPPPSQA